jgi:hypothetical protein
MNPSLGSLLSHFSKTSAKTERNFKHHRGLTAVRVSYDQRFLKFDVKRTRKPK